MILLLDTTTPTAKLALISDGNTKEFTWEAGRGLAKDLLGWLKQNLDDSNADWKDITGIGVLRGPGGFTGIRIGLTVCNTLADGLGIPIVGALGDDWGVECQNRLKNGENDKIVLPFYNSEAHITKPRK